MAPIKLHGNPFSPNTLRARLCLEEKALQYDFVHVDLTGQHKQQPFISLNPLGQVPALEDGDLTLFESRAITRYLAHTYADKGTPLLPNDPKKMAIVHVWMEVEALSFEGPGATLSFELATKPVLGLVTDEALVQQNEPKLAHVLDIYEARLAQSKYLGGEEFSLADLHHVPIVNNLFGTKVKALFDARPHVSAWAANILSRPAWKKVLTL